MEVKAETPEKRRMLPLKHQQAAFQSVYLKAQEGMKLPVRPAAAARFGLVAVISVVLMSPPVSSQRSISQDDRADESFNRRAALLKCLSVIMCCSPVCEKQALFALFQSYKENNVEEKLILKVPAGGREGGRCPQSHWTL